jgi:hypothetical protein
MAAATPAVCGLVVGAGASDEAEGSRHGPGAETPGRRRKKGKKRKERKRREEKGKGENK